MDARRGDGGHDGGGHGDGGHGDQCLWKTRLVAHYSAPGIKCSVLYQTLCFNDDITYHYQYTLRQTRNYFCIRKV